jgi:hypothetical protein
MFRLAPQEGLLMDRSEDSESLDDAVNRRCDAWGDLLYQPVRLGPQ